MIDTPCGFGLVNFYYFSQDPCVYLGLSGVDNCRFIFANMEYEPM